VVSIIVSFVVLLHVVFYIRKCLIIGMKVVIQAPVMVAMAVIVRATITSETATTLLKVLVRIEFFVSYKAPPIDSRGE